MDNLFTHNQDKSAQYVPLADQLRPKTLEDVVGHEKLVGENGILHSLIASKSVPSIIFWGPAGTGKTTLARIVASMTDLHFEQLSAIQVGVPDLKKTFAAAKMRRENGVNTLLFVDEIHRFNKSQQDVFLPYVEDGTIVLFGATTENPSFDLNDALLSRCQIITLERLSINELKALIKRAEDVTDRVLNIEEDALDLLVHWADGDGRFLLNCVEQLWTLKQDDKAINIETLERQLQRRGVNYDKNKDGHYNLASALHKAVRGSDVNGALYWFSRMLDGGEDPRFLARRIVRMASEEVGMADPQAMVQAIAARDTYEFLGSPEGELAIAQALVYVATAPKSNALYKAYNEARAFSQKQPNFMPPKHILNAPTKMMKEQDYGKGYQYDHDHKDAYAGQEFFPSELNPQEFYRPNPRGFERDIEKRLHWWQKLKMQRKEENNG